MAFVGFNTTSICFSTQIQNGNRKNAVVSDNVCSSKWVILCDCPCLLGKLVPATENRNTVASPKKKAVEEAPVQAGRPGGLVVALECKC